MSLMPQPEFVRVVRDGVASWTDPELRERAGVVVAFSERTGGTSEGPFASLNLASHVGDEPDAVDANRSVWLESLGLSACRGRLTMAEQVHSEHVHEVGEDQAGLGAYAGSGPEPVGRTDAMVTTLRETPLVLCFADCVPVVLVAPGPAVAVVHAGWRGALASLPGKTALALSHATRCDESDLVAYAGPHIGACHYQVDVALMSRFVSTFGTVARAESGCLDLDVAVTKSLTSAGVAPRNIVRLGVCTAEATDRFFSYRTEGRVTGRHAALACVL